MWLLTLLFMSAKDVFQDNLLKSLSKHNLQLGWFAGFLEPGFMTD